MQNILMKLLVSLLLNMFIVKNTYNSFAVATFRCDVFDPMFLNYCGPIISVLFAAYSANIGRISRMEHHYRIPS
jgi:uncharacterized integral membrane protein